MEEHFNHRAESFDSPKNTFLAQLVYDQIRRQVPDLSGKTILDFGGGTGLITLPLAKDAKSVTLVDIADKMLDQARIKAKKQELQNLTFLCRDLLAEPLEDTFDLIIVSRVLHHLPDLDKTLALFHRHLKDQGQLFIADYTKTSKSHHGFIIADLEEDLRQGGFSDIKSQILYSSDHLFLGNPSQLFLTSAKK